MDFKFLKIEKQNRIWTITLNRPEALNALNSDVFGELDQALIDARKGFPKECLGLIITGAGEKAFVAGADIKEMQGVAPDVAKTISEKGQYVFRRIESLPMPVIAAVNGFALGGGLELAMSCDFIYASENARLGLPEVSLGLLPGFGGTVRLTRLVGLNQAREMILTGEMIKASEALALRLVNKVLPLAELLPTARKTLETIATRGPLAVKFAKRTVLATNDQTIETGLSTEAAAFADLFTSKDALEGTTAFIEKRKPNFEGI